MGRVAAIDPVELAAARGARREHTFPVVELFGPTIQGEGPRAGEPTMFVRLGGCDYRCSWCDSLPAVDPARVREARRLSAPAILAEVVALAEGHGTRWVVLSGGNPALHHLGDLTALLHGAGFLVAVETQGSVWRPWLAVVDQLVVSPKPPSSGMATRERVSQTEWFMAEARRWWGDGLAVAVKFVVFPPRDDDAADDFEWAADRIERWGLPDTFLSCGTPQPDWGEYVPTPAQRSDASDAAVRMVLDNYRWLCDRAKGDPRLAGTQVLPQLHVLAWGLVPGV